MEDALTGPTSIPTVSFSEDIESNFVVVFRRSGIDTQMLIPDSMPDPHLVPDTKIRQFLNEDGGVNLASIDRAVLCREETDRVSAWIAYLHFSNKSSALKTLLKTLQDNTIDPEPITEDSMQWYIYPVSYLASTTMAILVEEGMFSEDDSALTVGNRCLEHVRFLISPATEHEL